MSNSGKYQLYWEQIMLGQSKNVLRQKQQEHIVLCHGQLEFDFAHILCPKY